MVMVIEGVNIDFVSLFAVVYVTITIWRLPRGRKLHFPEMHGGMFG